MTKISDCRTIDSAQCEFTVVRGAEDFPAWATREDFVAFLHHTMQPYNDTLEDTARGVSHALGEEGGNGGFIVLERVNGGLAGGVVMLNTGMKGYVPEVILLMISVDPRLRGKGLGRHLIERAVAECRGEVKLHVESDNPARRLYERLGFEQKYLEMRLSR